MERKKLGKCQVALISQDEQGPMLSVRFACVSNRAAKPQRGQLELHQGLLGLFHGQICGAGRLARTTLRVAKTMFQARRKPPSGWRGKAPTFFKKAWQHFRGRVEPRRQSFACSMFQNKMLLPDADAAEEMFASDAAADELRAGRLLSLRDHFPAETFPAMKIRLRDSAHAVQRQLSAVLTCCIPSKQPCAERTTNRQLPCWLRFAKRDLQSAKPRHSSLQKPMGRFILLADAFLATAHERLSRHQACLSMSPFQRKLCCKSKDIASKDQCETPKGCSRSSWSLYSQRCTCKWL